MNKVKIFAYVILVIFLLIALAEANNYRNKFRKERAEKERLEGNQEELLKEKADFTLIKQSLDEFRATISSRVDSAIRAERIKPKQIERVVERHYFYRDTSYQSHRPEPVISDSSIIYPFTDVKDCFTVGGFMELQDQRPVVTITERKFENNSTDIAYIERSRRFLFIKFGKWKGRLKTINQCGSTTTKEIEIIK